MAQKSKAQDNKDLLTRLADRGEQVVGRITELPGAKTLVDTTAALAKRVDEIQRRVRSLDPLEKRVTEIEKRLDKVEGKGSTTARKKPAAKRSTTSAKKPSTPKSTSS